MVEVIADGAGLRLVGATAAEHGLKLASRDRRALETYRALGVEVEFLA